MSGNFSSKGNMTPHSSNPRPEEMHRMQEEALRRVQEMQSRARTHLEHSREAEPPPPEPEHSSQAPEKEPLALSSGESLLTHLLQDQERTLILALLVLLGSDDSRPELLFALLFLLL